MKRCRRILSHHGSDCPDGPHRMKDARCIILTRIDRPNQLSEAWLTGDWTESRIRQAKRHTFSPLKPVWYGGGFWNRVRLEPPAATPRANHNPTRIPADGSQPICQCGRNWPHPIELEAEDRAALEAASAGLIRTAEDLRELAAEVDPEAGS